MKIIWHEERNLCEQQQHASELTVAKQLPLLKNCLAAHSRLAKSGNSEWYVDNKLNSSIMILFHCGTVLSIAEAYGDQLSFT
jgi:hypothetical protein